MQVRESGEGEGSVPEVLRRCAASSQACLYHWAENGAAAGGTGLVQGNQGGLEMRVVSRGSSSMFGFPPQGRKHREFQYRQRAELWVRKRSDTGRNCKVRLDMRELPQEVTLSGCGLIGKPPALGAGHHGGSSPSTPTGDRGFKSHLPDFCFALPCGVAATHRSLEPRSQVQILTGQLVFWIPGA